MAQGVPKGFRLHIGIFGRRNVGKSSLLNAITRQNVSIVSTQAGTTTDPVEKPMEFLPLGPVLFIDTAGIPPFSQHLLELRGIGLGHDIGVFSSAVSAFQGFRQSCSTALEPLNGLGFHGHAVLGVSGGRHFRPSIVSGGFLRLP